MSETLRGLGTFCFDLAPGSAIAQLGLEALRIRKEDPLGSEKSKIDLMTATTVGAIDGVLSLMELAGMVEPSLFFTFSIPAGIGKKFLGSLLRTTLSEQR